MSSFLIPAVTITLVFLFLSPTSTVADFVVDANGDYVQNGGSYYIISVMPGSGPINWEPNNSTDCPLYIKPKAFTSGTPVRIYSLLSQTRLLPVSSPVIFSFYGVNTPCLQPLFWSASADNGGNESYVLAGSGSPVVASVFHIDKTESRTGNENVYKIIFCYQHGKGCDIDVGLIKGNGLLGTTPGKPLPVIFAKYVPKPTSFM